MSVQLVLNKISGPFEFLWELLNARLIMMNAYHYSTNRSPMPQVVGAGFAIAGYRKRWQEALMVALLDRLAIERCGNMSARPCDEIKEALRGLSDKADLKVRSAGTMSTSDFTYP